MGDQKGGDAKGVWNCEDIHRLRRFLGYGFETGCCKVEPENKSDKKKESGDFAKKQATSIVSMINDGKGREVVAEIVKFSDDRAVRQNSAVFALALCAHVAKDLETVQAAYRALSIVCRTPTHLFAFVKYGEKLKEKASGWGAGQRRAISRWYNDKDPLHLALLVTKYIERNGWSHVDVLRLSHVKPKNDAIAAVLRYATKGYAEMQNKYDTEDATDDIKEVLKYLQAVNTVKHTRDEQQAAAMITQYQLCREHIATWHSKSQEVWRALVPHMPMTALLRNLSKLSALKLLDAEEQVCTAKVVEKLGNKDKLAEDKIHPFAVLRALKGYESGKGAKGKKKWQPNPKIVAALDTAFYDSFENVTPTGKRYLLALDISQSMSFGGAIGSTPLKPADIATAMAMVTARRETSYQMVAFASDVVEISITPKMKFGDISKEVCMLKEGNTDCCKVIKWALDNKKAFDVILVYTDGDAWPSMEQRPVELLRQYRVEMDLPDAKLIVCAVSSPTVTVADPDDCGMLDVAGFDTMTPTVINRFVNNEL